MNNLFSGIYTNKTVLVTGHTGFKGSWLVLWLKEMGANVIGYSLDAPTNPNHLELLNLNIPSIIGDIKDSRKLNQVFSKYKPDIVFHLAAQALVRYSYINPIETYETNVIGSLKIFEACRKYKVKAIVNITSDKAYENKEQTQAYKEDEALGGYDPYSASKACSEILSASYRNSYFNINEYKLSHNTLLATCRAGNVIGGGDWAKDRLIPDIMTSISKNKVVSIRNPKAIRPWQHVLEPLSGYLLIGQKLLEEDVSVSTSWNLGPKDLSINVKDILTIIKEYWHEFKYEVLINEKEPHETKLLKLDSSKAFEKLKWVPTWGNKQAIEATIFWYKNYYKTKQSCSHNDLIQYIKCAKNKKAIWTLNND